MSSGSPEGAAGFFYGFGIHMGLGRGPVNELIEARMGGKLGWQGSVTSEDPTRFIDSPNLFGGPAKEGGIQGPFTLLNGEPGQDLQGSFMDFSLIAPAVATGFRRMCTVYFDGFIAALNPYPKPWSWRVRRTTKGWDGDVLRPDLAMIPLLGEPIAPPAGSAKPWAEHVEELIIPITNGVVTIATPPAGCDITHVTAVLASDDDSGNGNPSNPPFEFTLLPDGTAEVRVPINCEGQYIKSSFYYNDPFGTPGFQGSSVQFGNNVPNKALLTIATPPGTTVASTITITHRVYVGPSYTDQPIGPFSLVSTVPGETIYAVSPKWLNVLLKATFNYVGSSSGLGNDEKVCSGLQNPPVVELTPPGGGDVKDINFINVAYFVEESEFHTQPEVRAVPYTLDGNNVTLIEAAEQGKPIPISYNYYLNLGGGPLTPIREIKAMNPAHIIFEALTNREWGRGLDRSVIDITSFEVAAQTLVDEDFGACGRWARRDSIASFIQSILDMIGATLYTNRTNALLTLFLIRGDYDRNALKLWDTSNGILEITESTVNTATVVINEIIVRYRDPVFNEDRTVNVQNLASLQSSGGAFNTRTVDYKFCPTAGLALRLAQRDLRSYAQGLRRFKMTMDRRGYQIFPGSVMRIQDLARKVPDMVVRVATVKDGILTDGKITLDVVQDVFSFPSKSFVTPQPNEWAPAVYTPCIGEHKAFEAPYFLLRRMMSNADFAYLEDTSAYMITVADQGQSTNIGYRVAVRDSAPTPDDVPLPADQLYCGYTP